MNENATGGTAPVRETWQARKSAETRTEILEAAIQSYVEVGYSRTTLQQIADRTGLSRGAIIYHFPSMLEVTRAAVSYLEQAWLANYRRRLEKLTLDETFVDQAMQALWEQFSGPLHTVFQELVVAARTDPQLQAIVEPAQEEFSRQFYRLSLEHAVTITDDDDRFDLATGMAQYLLTGMAVGGIWSDTDERRRRLLEYSSKLIDRLMREGPDALL